LRFICMKKGGLSSEFFSCVGPMALHRVDFL
jgi:hypothetical protein